MNNSDFTRIENIFSEAASLPAPERAAFLDRVCGDDSELRRRVEELLEHDRSTGELPVPPASADPFVVDPANPAGPNDPADPAAPRSLPQNIGPYRVLERLGEGGFAEVFAAEQLEPVKRHVAVKVLKPGMDSGAVLARFEAERQALALMDHPHVAKAFDAGTTESGRPYFVMELVRGEPATRFADRHGLSVRERLELFVSICRAVQHAHQKGVIHRDLKPSNLLVSQVDGRPHAMVIDFGIAKAMGASLTEETLHTAEGFLIGTPEYMSPEQAEFGREDIDTRSDIYSLGVVLYELLTGALPFEHSEFREAGLSEIQRILREVEPPRPSARRADRMAQSSDPVVPADRGSGPSDPVGGADHEPRELRASRPSPIAPRDLRGDLDWIVLKAMSKDRDRRYDTAASFADDIVRHLADEPVLAGPPGVSYRLGKFAKRNRAGLAVASSIGIGLVIAAAALGVSAVRADRERDKTVAALAEAQAVTDFLTRTLAAAGPRQQGRDVTVREILDASRESLERDFLGQPLVQAHLRNTIGATYQDLGEPAAAESMYVRAHETYAAELGALAPRTLEVENNLASVQVDLGNLGAAESLSVEVLARREQVLGPDHTETLSTLTHLASVYAKQGRHAEADSLLQRAYDGYVSLAGPDSPDAYLTLGGLGEMYSQQGKAEAESVLVAARDGCRTVFGPEHPRTLVVETNLASLYFRSGRFDEALPVAESVLAVRRRILGDEHADTMETMNLLASCYLRLDRLEECVALFEEVLTLTRRELGEEHPNSLVFANNVGSLYRRLGRYDEAAVLYESTLAIGRDVLGPGHPHMILAMGNLGDVFTNRREFSRCGPQLAEAVAVARENLPEGHWIVGETLRKQGVCLTGAGEWADAEIALLEANAILLAAHGDAHPRVASCAENLAELYEQSGRPDEAVGWRK